MSNFLSVRKREQCAFAAFLLYMVSLLGILELWGSANIVGNYTRLAIVNVGAYVVLGLLAYGIYKGVRISKWVYLVAATAWYVVLMGVLPQRFGHALNIDMVFIQVILSVLAFVILCVSPKVALQQER
jgi:hypothetical protein